MSERSDQEISDLLEEGRILAGNKCGSESNGSPFRCEFTIKGERKLYDGRLFEMTLSLKSEKYCSAKNRVNERVLQYYHFQNLFSDWRGWCWKSQPSKLWHYRGLGYIKTVSYCLHDEFNHIESYIILGPTMFSEWIISVAYFTPKIW